MTYDPLRPNNDMRALPLDLDYKDPDLLIQLNKTNIALIKLNEVSKRIPNKGILIEFVSIKEWVSSNEIENIHTTIEEVFVSELIQNQSMIKKEDKEIIYYKDAILYGYNKVKTNSALMVNDIIELNKILLQNNQWIVSSPNKHIKEGNEIIYTPPQWIDIIRGFLDNFEKCYNEFDEKIEIDPLLKMSMIHYQFEAIHPFGDGNGRVWRILVVLYLVLHSKIDLPILFLSEHIAYHKSDYYDHLKQIDQKVPNALYYFTFWFLLLVEVQAKKTMLTIMRIEGLMWKTKELMKWHPKLGKVYSHELIDYLFTRPYYSIDWLQKTLWIHRHTASAYFRLLAEEKIVEPIKIGRNQYYFNYQFLHELKYWWDEN